MLSSLLLSTICYTVNDFWFKHCIVHEDLVKQISILKTAQISLISCSVRNILNWELTPSLCVQFRPNYLHEINQMFAMHDTSLEWTVYLDSFCLLQNYWTWKWCNDDNKMSFFSTIHIYLSLFYWYVVIFVLTLFLWVGWIVSLHHATYSRDGGSIPVDHLLAPCFFSLYILSLTFHFPIPLFFHFRFIFNLFDTCPQFPFSPHSPPPKFIPSLQLYSFLFPSHFLSFSTSSFSISYLIFVCNSLLNFALITSIKSLIWAFHRKHRSSRKQFLTINRLHTIVFTYAHRD